MARLHGNFKIIVFPFFEKKICVSLVRSLDFIKSSLETEIPAYAVQEARKQKHQIAFIRAGVAPEIMHWH